MSSHRQTGAVRVAFGLRSLHTLLRDFLRGCVSPVPGPLNDGILFESDVTPDSECRQRVALSRPTFFIDPGGRDAEHLGDGLGSDKDGAIHVAPQRLLSA